MKTGIFLIFLWLVASSLAYAQTSDSLPPDTGDMLNTATALLKNKEYGRAIAMAGEALEQHTQRHDSLGMAGALHLISRCHALAGDFREAVLYGEKGATLSQSLDTMELEFRINNILTWAYFMTGREFNHILGLERRQVLIAEKINDPEAKAMVYNNYGYDTTVSGSITLEDSIRYMQEANSYYSAEEGHSGRWYTLMNLCWQYRLKGAFAKSEEHGLLAARQAMQEKDRHAIIETYSHLAETLLARNKADEAAEYYKVAKEWRGGTNDRDSNVFDVYYAHYLWQTGAKEKAITMLEKAIHFLSTSEVFYEAHARALLSGFYFERGGKEKALEQALWFENPRGDYISLESRLMAEVVKNKIQQNHQGKYAISRSLDSLLAKARAIGAGYLVDKAG